MGKYSGGASYHTRVLRVVGKLCFCAAIAGFALNCKTKTETVTTAGGTTLTSDANLLKANIIDYHANFGKTDTDNERCLNCHGDMKSQETLNKDVLVFHARHAQITSTYKCTDCHTKVDLLQSSGEKLRSQVDVEAACATCHGPDSTHPLYQISK